MSRIRNGTKALLRYKWKIEAHVEKATFGRGGRILAICITMHALCDMFLQLLAGYQV